MTAEASPPLYAVQDRRESGEWRTLGEYVDVLTAHQVAALLRAAGAEARVELVPTQGVIP